ncbi:MAG: alkaline phosphatase family protein [Planctomycetota bacterium]
MAKPRPFAALSVHRLAGARRPTARALVGALLALTLPALPVGCTPGKADPPLPAVAAFSTCEPIGRDGWQRSVLPVSQIVTPAGLQVDLPGLRPQAIALSPDGRLLVTSGKTPEIVVLDTETGAVRQRVALPAEPPAEAPAPAVAPSPPDTEGQLSYTGLVFAPDGSRLYLANVNGSVKVFGIAEDATVSPLYSIPLPPTGLPRRERALPSGMAASSDGKLLYVTLNLSNRLLELDLDTHRALRLFDVGVAPYDVVVTNAKAYVSNWGGRRPAPGDLTGPAGRGTLVRVDSTRHIASEGSVSVIDLAAGHVTKELLVGLHASALALSPDQHHVAVANAAGDTVSVIDTERDEVVETIPLNAQPGNLFGASPNALAFDASGETLYVANGTQNAVAVVAFRPGHSRLRGLIPVGWFPGALAFDAPRRRLYVANMKGLSTGRENAQTRRLEFNSHQYAGSLSLVPLPDDAELARHTARMLENVRRATIEAALLPPRPGEPPRPVPERAGERSVFRHVVYIIKENRTYDQVLGDIAEGNGDPSLCVFGAAITPNQHKLARDFVLLDNIYCSGILSADGHQWCDTAFATDYLEKSFAGFPRSYPDGMLDDDVDALAYAPSGFIWDNAIAHGKTLRVYGEFAITEKRWKDASREDPITFLDHYRDFTDKTGLIEISSRPAIESLRPYLCTSTVGWDMDIPDIFRAARFIEELREFEERGEFPDLVIICLPNDHTSGTSPGHPTPAAHVADNDLAFGRIVEALSRSRFWKETCLFAIEDDPQAGWDHVSGYRTTAYVVSPYTKRSSVISTQYNQPGIVRTIELILGLPPMNQMDAAATPLFDCFTSEPDFTPYEAIAAGIPLDTLNPAEETLADPLMRRLARLSAELPLENVDRCDEDLLNRIVWHAQMGPLAPYPEWALLRGAERGERAGR